MYAALALFALELCVVFCTNFPLSSQDSFEDCVFRLWVFASVERAYLSC